MSDVNLNRVNYPDIGKKKRTNTTDRDKVRFVEHVKLYQSDNNNDNNHHNSNNKNNNNNIPENMDAPGVRRRL